MCAAPHRPPAEVSRWPRRICNGPDAREGTGAPRRLLVGGPDDAVIYEVKSEGSNTGIEGQRAVVVSPVDVAQGIRSRYGLRRPAYGLQASREAGRRAPGARGFASLRPPAARLVRRSCWSGVRGTFCVTRRRDRHGQSLRAPRPLHDDRADLCLRHGPPELARPVGHRSR